MGRNTQLERVHASVVPSDKGRAADAYQRLIQWAIETDDPALNHKVAVYAHRDGFAAIAVVAAERAVALNPDDALYRETLSELRESTRGN